MCPVAIPIISVARMSAVKNRWLIYLVVASLGYLVVLTTLGRFPNICGDEIYFKAAGREWAATGRFAAPELRGAFKLQPPLEEVWLPYPPLYPALFGCFVKAFGFGWRQCVSFDALIHVCLALLTFSVAGNLSAGADRRAAFWAGLAVLPLGVAGRPDDLAICIGMAALLPLLPPMADNGRALSLTSSIASGALFGLCAGTSIVAAIVLGLIAMGYVVVRSKTPVGIVVFGLVWVGTAATVFAILIAPILLKHPDAYRQYPAVMREVFRSDTRRYWQKIVHWLTLGRLVSFPVLGLMVLGLGTIVNSLRRNAIRRWSVLWLGPFAGVLFLLVFDPHNYLYLWFLGPYVLAVVAVTLTDPGLAPKLLGAQILRGFFVLLVLFGSTETVKQTIILAILSKTQSMEYNAHQIRDIVPPRSTVFNYDSWWFLGNDYSVHDPVWAPSTHWSEVDYIVIQNCPLSQKFEDYVRTHFRLIHDNRSRTPCTLFGVPLSRSKTGFGARIFARQ
jgi:hypothetical protein